VIEQRPHRPVGQAEHTLVHFLRVLVEEMVHEQRDVLAPRRRGGNSSFTTFRRNSRSSRNCFSATIFPDPGLKRR
jgi:hypothetical protein